MFCLVRAINQQSQTQYHVLFSQSFAFVVSLFLVVVGFSKMVPFSQYLIAQYNLSFSQYKLSPGSKY